MKRCPQCNSTEVTLYMGGQFGKYQCKKCGYVGPLIVEEPNEEIRKKIKGKKSEKG